MSDHLHGNAAPFLTTKELAERWHTSPGSIRNMRQRGLTLRGYKIGRGVLWSLADVVAFEESRSESNRTE